MSGRKRFFMFTMTAIFLLAAVLAIAQARCGKGGTGPGGMGMRGCFEDLDLTPDQENKIIDQKFQHMQETLPLKRDLQKKQLEMKTELDKDAPSQAVLDRISDEITALQGKLKKSRLHFILSIRSILTKEQWQEAKESLLERRERGPRMDRPPMGMEPGKGPCKMAGAPGNAPAPPPGPPADDED